MRLQELKQHVSDTVVDVHDLVDFLELTIEDVIDRFPDRLVENQEKFGVMDD